MIKKVVCTIIALSITFLLCGCWDYRGLNEMTIVSGIGIDRNSSTGDYHVVYEVVDLNSSADKGSVKAKLIESDGKTIFDAVRNAKKRLTNKLYFGNSQVIIVGSEIAEQGGLKDVIDWFLRDSEGREVLCVAISQEKTAKDILSIYGIDNSLVANEIDQITNLDVELTASTLDSRLYNIYNTFRSKGKSLVLPAIHNVMNDEDLAVEVNGLAVFKEDKMLGYLDPTETKYYLFATNQIKGGLLTFSMKDNQSDDITLEISENKTKASYSYKDGKIKVLIKTETKVNLGEYQEPANFLDEKEISKIESKAEETLEKNIKDAIKNVQSKYDSDIFGFGNMIYKKEPKLWKKLEKNWDNTFKTIEVKVDSEIEIDNTAMLKKS